MMRAPYQLNRKTAADKPFSAIDMSLGLAQIAQIAQELADLKEKHSSEFAKMMTEKKTEMDLAIARAKKMTKGDKGDMPIAGVHFPVPTDGISPDPGDVADIVMSRIKVPRDGVDAKPIDVQGIVKTVVAQIRQPSDGKDAIFDEEKMIDKIIEKIKKEKKLKPEHIDGFIAEMTSYRAQLAGKHYGTDTTLRGGGDRVKAGSNVTITDNSDGTRTITAAGGSFTALAPTETPNGVLKVFTFAAAVAQPTYMRVDNTLVKAVSKSGTVNWTWASGPKQVTLTISPIDDIEGIV